MNWSTIDPNNVLLVALAVLGLFGYGAKSKAARVLDAARSVVTDGLDHVVDRLELGAGQVTVAELEVEGEWLLKRAGIAKSKATDLLVHELAVGAHAELWRRLNERAASKLPAEVDALADQAQAVVDAFIPKGRR